MVNTEQTNTTPNPFTVVTWNILLDNTRTNQGLMKSQSERLASQIATLEKLREKIGGELDVVAMQEVHRTDLQHNGEELARALGYGAGYWIEHNQKPFPDSPTGRKGEYVGLFGGSIDHIEPIELGDNRRAVLSQVGKTAIANIHPRARVSNWKLQEEQVKIVLEQTKDYESMAFVGDFNNRLGGKARQAIEAEGFESVFSVMGKRHPKTWPTPAYRRLMYGRRARFFAPAVTLDDIYVRGLTVHDAGTFVGDSDHVGLWAKLSKDDG